MDLMHITDDLTMVNEGHVGGFIIQKDPATYTPHLWKYLCKKFNIKTVLDVGCGVGATTKHFLDEFAPRAFKGVDTSAASIDVARQGYHSTEKTSDCEVRFACLSDTDLLPQYDLVYCNGVFHHIDIEKRLEAMRFIAGSLRPGGVFAFWENNPYSLPARYVMSRIPFDHDAVMVWPRATSSAMGMTSPGRAARRSNLGAPSAWWGAAATAPGARPRCDAPGLR